MKILRGKSIFGLMYAILLAIPMVSVISKVIYVQSNKNAYMSYSGTSQQQVATPLYATNEVESAEDLVIGNYYLMSFTASASEHYSTTPFIIDADSGNNIIRIIKYTFNCNNQITIAETSSEYDYFDFCTSAGSSSSIELLTGDDDTDVGLINIHSSNITAPIVFDFTMLFQYISASSSLDINYVSAVNDMWQVYDISYIDASTLDNVFEYAIDETIKDNNYGKIDFLSWFNNMFLDNNTDVNNRYTRYVNWYLNYTMFISCAYLLFLVLMWFINFARKLLDRGMNYDW